VLNSRHGNHAGHVEPRTRNVVINLTGKRAEGLLRAQNAPTQIFLVERGVRESNRKVVPIVARDVAFSVAGIEK
jgi:hypothetical protein